MPIVSIVLLGMPFGIPVSGSFGIYITVMFYSPLKGLLIYDYPKYYLLLSDILLVFLYNSCGYGYILQALSDESGGE